MEEVGLFFGKMGEVLSYKKGGAESRFYFCSFIEFVDGLTHVQIVGCAG